MAAILAVVLVFVATAYVILQMLILSVMLIKYTLTWLSGVIKGLLGRIPEPPNQWPFDNDDF